MSGRVAWTWTPRPCGSTRALLKGYRPKLVGTLMSLIPKDEVTTEVKKDDLERGEHALKKGDRVVVLTEDFQTYYILCKVVET